jgi:hypothetical protein
MTNTTQTTTAASRTALGAMPNPAGNFIQTQLLKNSATSPIGAGKTPLTQDVFTPSAQKPVTKPVAPAVAETPRTKIDALTVFGRTQQAQPATGQAKPVFTPPQPTATKGLVTADAIKGTHAKGENHQKR